MINFLDAACEIEGLENILHYAVMAIKVIQIVAPIALIIWGSIDLLKGVIAGDDKKIAAARKPFIQRLISAIIILLIPWIVTFVINAFVDDGNEWKKCYNAAKDATEATKVSTDPGQDAKN